MMIGLKKFRSLGFFMKLSILFLLLLFLSVNIGINKSYNQKTNVLETSNEGQDYWPTDGWLNKTPEDQDMDSKKLTEMHNYIEEETLNIRSVIVVRNGYIIDEGYLTNTKFRPVREDYRREMHNIFSVTKSITSLCIGVAIKKGYINNVSQTFFEFFPELWDLTYDLRKKNITLEHLLTMTSGIEWDESSVAYDSMSNDYTQLYLSSNWIQFYLDKPMMYDPGENFAYSGGSSMLLSAIIQKVTNKTTSEFAHENLFTPLGIIEEHWRWETSPQGMSNGAAYLFMTPRDMAKIGLLCLNNGTWDGEEIISKDYVLAATINQQPTFSDSTYGYQFWIQDWFLYDGYAAIGWRGQRIVVFPAVNIFVVFTSDISNFNYYLDYLIEEFILAAIGVEPDPPEDPVNGNPITGYPITILWSLMVFAILGILYLTNKKKRHILDSIKT
jgi:CubicO group peptidase (beta-lactamase class C family)